MGPENETTQLQVQITANEKESAKRLARASGMTFQGWLGMLVKRELEASSKSVEEHRR